MGFRFLSRSSIRNFFKCGVELDFFWRLHAGIVMEEKPKPKEMDQSFVFHIIFVLIYKFSGLVVGQFLSLNIIENYWNFWWLGRSKGIAVIWIRWRISMLLSCWEKHQKPLMQLAWNVLIKPEIKFQCFVPLHVVGDLKVFFFGFFKHNPEKLSSQIPNKIYTFKGS